MTEDIRKSRATGLMMAKSRLSMLTTAEVNRMAYMDMKNSLYYGGTLGYYAVVLIGACLINSVTIVFDFVAAFAASAIAFGFPGLFYLYGIKKFGGGTQSVKIWAYIYCGIACFNCLLGLTSTIMTILCESNPDLGICPPKWCSYISVSIFYI